MKKDIVKYAEKYGEVPKNYFERFLYIIEALKLRPKDIEDIQKAIRKMLKLKWEEVNFIVYFFPKATPRARYSGRTRVFYVKDAANYNQFFKEFMETSDYKEGLITTPTQFITELYLPIPSVMSRVDKILSELKFIRPIVKPDWDNAGKTYSDMIQSHLLLDDSLIVDGTVRKYYSFKPRIEIKVRFMTQYDSKFTKKKVESWKTYKDVEDKIMEKDSIV